MELGAYFLPYGQKWSILVIFMVDFGQIDREKFLFPNPCIFWAGQEIGRVDFSPFSEIGLSSL